MTGFLAGAVHVLAGPDHLAALAPMALRGRGRALHAGAGWGLGHGLGVVFLGLLAVLGRSLVRIEVFSAWSEWLVGFALIGVGGWILATSHQVHDHPHSPTDTRAALGVGLLHGAAGGAHVIGLLPALALSWGSALTYLGCYLLGALASMVSVAGLLGWVARRAGPSTLPRLVQGAGVLSIVVGAAWLLPVGA